MQCALTSAVAVAPARVSSQRPSRRTSVVVRAEEAKAAAPEPKVRLLQAPTNPLALGGGPSRAGRRRTRSLEAVCDGSRAAGGPPGPAAAAGRRACECLIGGGHARLARAARLSFQHSQWCHRGATAA